MHKQTKTEHKGAITREDQKEYQSQAEMTLEKLKKREKESGKRPVKIKDGYYVMMPKDADQEEFIARHLDKVDHSRKKLQYD